MIARHEASNPNRKLLENQMRDQLMKSLEASTHAALTPPPLDVNDVTIPAAPGQVTQITDRVVAAAEKLGGSATREIPDAKSTGVLVDVPANRENEFRAAMAELSGLATPSPLPNDTATAGTQRKSFVVHIVETALR
jgi:hypothetical protein